MFLIYWGCIINFQGVFKLLIQLVSHLWIIVILLILIILKIVNILHLKRQISGSCHYGCHLKFRLLVYLIIKLLLLLLASIVIVGVCRCVLRLIIANILGRFIQTFEILLLTLISLLIFSVCWEHGVVVYLKRWHSTTVLSSLRLGSMILPRG